MRKNYILLLILSLCYTLLLGHSIIPHKHVSEHLVSEQDAHHHHDSHSHEHDHHHHDHDSEKGGQQDDGLEHAFSHFMHAEDGITFLTNETTYTTQSKKTVSVVAVVPEFACSYSFSILPLLRVPPWQRPDFFISHYASSFGLRAPPAVS